MFNEFIQSPCGIVEVQACDQGITAIRFVESEASASVPSAVTTKACEQLRAYFAGELTTFDLPLAPAGTLFQQRVWNALRDIPYGATCSYRDIAEAKGRARSRARKWQKSHSDCDTLPPRDWRQWQAHRLCGWVASKSNIIRA